MAIQFGIGTLSVLTNNLFTGAAVTTATVSAVTSQQLNISSGLVMIDGVTCVVSGINLTVTALGNTGNSLMVYAYLDTTTTVTITATIAHASAAHQINTASNIPTAICPLARFDFGTAADRVGNIVAWSGGSATKTIARVQNVSINVSFESQQMRGGGDVFAVDSQFFDGKAEGSFQFAEQTAIQNLFLGGIYSSAGAASGTWTLSGTSRPEQVSLVFQNTTNGITSTYTLLRAYLTQQSNDFSRTDYEQPSYNFIGQSNNKGSVMTIIQ